jgi:putative ABC transport system substrate-binding protein
VLSTGFGHEMPEFEGLRRGLRELGYVDGENLALAYRFGQGRLDAMPRLAAELVALEPDVIVAHGLQGCQAAKEATSTIPIVFGEGADPVALGFVASLARPGGNMTGLVHSPSGLNAKRLQLLKDAAPGVRRVAVLVRPDSAQHALNLAEAEAAARTLGVQVQPIELGSAEEVEAAFEAAAAWRSDALFALPDALFFELRTPITARTTRARLPAVFREREFAQSGGLLAYGANLQENFRRAAAYVDKILKGARPADLPVEQPARFDFVVNLKTAETLGLAIPQAVREQATEVVV